MRKYRQGARIDRIDDLLNQKYIMWNDKVYHKGFFLSWQMQFILNRLRSGEFYKAIPIDLHMFVCYEENKHDLAIESGAINQLTVFSNKATAIDWFFDRIKVAKDYGFVIDKESDLLNNGEVDKKLILGAIKTNEYVSVTMFSGWQENWDESFDIVIEFKECGA